MHYIPNLCKHCDEPPCIDACPVEGAIYKRDDGLVIIDPVKCTGCKKCVDACPYGAIYFNDDLNLAQKCTGCAHLLDDGEWDARCVDACPTEAIKFGEESELADLIARAEVIKPESATKPRVYYLNIPKKFIAGTVYDPIEKEVVIGATCTLTPAPAASSHGRRPTSSAILVPRPRGRRLRASHPGRRLRGASSTRRQHGEGREPRRHPAVQR